MAPDKTLQSRLPPLAPSLFDAKKKKGYTFADIASKLGNRDEVWVAALFYGQAKPDNEDIKKLAEVLDVRESYLVEEYGEDFFPDKGKLVDMPPRDPLIYRLYEMVSIYGYAYKAIIHEKFGDGIMSAISFSTKIEKEVDEAGTWVKITQRGKFLPYTKF